MSLMKTVEASPSRVYAIYALLFQLPKQRAEVHELRRMLMPNSFSSKDSDRKETDFVGSTIPEMVSLGLVQRDQDTLSIPDPPSQTRLKPDEIARLLPHMIRERVVQPSSEANEDLAGMIAWYLAQNPYRAPGNSNEVERALHEQLQMKITNAPYGQFEDWVMYMGFASRIQKRLLPDPTEAIRFYLPQLFEGSRTQRIDTIVQRLAKLCPVFERGIYRERMLANYKGETLLEGHLSQATSFAWLRLRDEGVVQLEKRSDADVYLFAEQQTVYRFSEMTWSREGHEG